MNDIQPKPGQIRLIFAETWDSDGKVWFLAPYTLDELNQWFTSE